MSTITADPALTQMLSQVKDVAEVRGSDGALLGIFTPREVEEEKIKKLFDIKKANETYEREKGNCRPFSEIIAKLQKRAEQ
ncbi:MAG: hypothetical protein L0Y71_05255 [Gemmataceae bacterium]|nr:hypothetical protein [Gemmataceae bacterium]